MTLIRRETEGDNGDLALLLFVVRFTAVAGFCGQHHDFWTDHLPRRDGRALRYPCFFYGV